MNSRVIISIVGLAALLEGGRTISQQIQDSWQRVRSFDEDRDGKVSRNEFRGPEQLFNRMDADADGFVTEKEARAARRQMQRPGAVPDPTRARPAGGAMLVHRIDTDHNEQISLVEWTEFFKEADENGDEILQPEEWQAAMRQQPVHDPAPAVGQPVPKVKAKERDSGREVDLGEIRKPTVLVFGSYT